MCLGWAHTGPGRSVGRGAVGMRSRLFLTTFPTEIAREDKARRSVAEVTDHPPKPQTTLQVTSEQASARDVDAAVGGSCVCHWVCRSARSRSAEQGAQGGTQAGPSGEFLVGKGATAVLEPPTAGSLSSEVRERVASCLLA